MNLIQYNRAFYDIADAQAMHNDAKLQSGYVGGRLIRCTESTDPWLLTLFFHDECWDEMVLPLPLGAVRIYMPDCLRSLYGIT